MNKLLTPQQINKYIMKINLTSALTDKFFTVESLKKNFWHPTEPNLYKQVVAVIDYALLGSTTEKVLTKQELIDVYCGLIFTFRILITKSVRKEAIALIRTIFMTEANKYENNSDKFTQILQATHKPLISVK